RQPVKARAGVYCLSHESFPPVFVSTAGLCGRRGFFCSVQLPLTRRVAVPVERRVIGGDHHALDVEMIVEAFGAAFAPDAGIADAAPGRSRIEPVMIVDPDDAALHLRGDAM